MSPFIVLFFVPLFLGTECAEKCAETLQKVKLSPKYTKNIPDGDLKVQFSEAEEAKCGNELSVLTIVNSPIITYDVQGKCENVSIIFFDPDVPLPAPKLFLHWFATNIPADDIKNGYDSKTQECEEPASYFPPAMPTGNHRYTFCVYCQNEYVKKPKHSYDLLRRMGVSPRCLAKQNHLDDPEACNFFYLAVLNSEVTQPLKDIPIYKEVSDLNKDLGNNDKPPLL